MWVAAHDFEQLVREHGTLIREYARAQARCSEAFLVQAREIARLQAQVMRLNAEVIRRETVLAWAREDRVVSRESVSCAGEADALEAGLKAADLVICQTGCLSHGAFWRAQDHCKRTGKTCVLVEQPDALRIVRIHTASELEARVHEGEASMNAEGGLPNCFPKAVV